MLQGAFARQSSDRTGPTSDLRYQWVCAHLPRLEEAEMRELVVDAWRMCVPKMLHDLPDMPMPAARVWDLVEQQEWAEVRPLLHPYVESPPATSSCAAGATCWPTCATTRRRTHPAGSRSGTDSCIVGFAERSAQLGEPTMCPGRRPGAAAACQRAKSASRSGTSVNSPSP